VAIFNTPVEKPLSSIKAMMKYVSAQYLLMYNIMKLSVKTHIMVVNEKYVPNIVYELD